MLRNWQIINLTLTDKLNSVTFHSGTGRQAPRLAPTFPANAVVD